MVIIQRSTNNVFLIYYLFYIYFIRITRNRNMFTLLYCKLICFCSIKALIMCHHFLKLLKQCRSNCYHYKLVMVLQKENMLPPAYTSSIHVHVLTTECSTCINILSQQLQKYIILPVKCIKKFVLVAYIHVSNRN